MKVEMKKKNDCPQTITIATNYLHYDYYYYSYYTGAIHYSMLPTSIRVQIQANLVQLAKI